MKKWVLLILILLLGACSTAEVVNVDAETPVIPTEMLTATLEPTATMTPEPTISPSPTPFDFSSLEGTIYFKGGGSLYRLNAEGEPEIISVDIGVSYLFGNSEYFSCLLFSSNSIIYCYDAVSETIREIGELSIGNEPKLSPDGTMIVFGRSTPYCESCDDQDLFYLDLIEMKEYRLTDTNYIQRFPEWNIESDKVIYSKFLSEEHIGIVDINNGETEIILEFTSVSIFFAKWTPDGTKISFESWDYPSIPSEIYLYDVEQRDLITLTDTNSYDEINHNWSSDSDYLAFVSDECGERCVYIMDLETRSKMLVGKHSGWISFPIWSPDNELLLYSERMDRNKSIYELFLTGFDIPEPIQITNLGMGIYEYYWVGD